MFVPKRWRRKPSSLGMKTDWRTMCLEERSLRKTRRVKVQGAEAKAGRNTILLFSNEEGKNITITRLWSFTQKGFRTQIWFALTGSLHAWDWVWTASKFLPAMIHAQAKNVGNPQGHWNLGSTITEQDGLSLSIPGSKLSYFLLSNQPSRPVLQMPCLIKVKQDWCQKPQGSQNTFLHEVMISYRHVRQKRDWV